MKKKSASMYVELLLFLMGIFILFTMMIPTFFNEKEPMPKNNNGSDYNEPFNPQNTNLPQNDFQPPPPVNVPIDNSYNSQAYPPPPPINEPVNPPINNNPTTNYNNQYNNSNPYSNNQIFEQHDSNVVHSDFPIQSPPNNIR